MESKNNKGGQENSSGLRARLKSSHNRAKMLILWIVVIILAASTGVFAFLWYRQMQRSDDLLEQQAQLESKIDVLDKKLSEASKASQPTSPESDAEAETACDNIPSDGLKQNIKDALDSQNTAVFSTYTTNPVYYVLAASEYGGNITPDEAALSLEYTHSATGPWDFNLSAATVSAYDAGYYTDYFSANTYVGRSTDGMVVAFDVNCDDKISQIFVAHEDLL